MEKAKKYIKRKTKVYYFEQLNINLALVKFNVMKNITLFILVLISNYSTAQSEKLIRFYDFGIEIDFHHLLYDNDYKIFLSNGINYNNLNKNSLYKIQYSYDKNFNRVPIDTLKVELDKKEMDKLFVLTKNQFYIKYDENLSEYKIPPPPPVYDGMIVHLTLDLQFRGDKYMKVLSLACNDNNFKELNDFVERLMNKYRSK
jgi:hypothetical protein